MNERRNRLQNQWQQMQELMKRTGTDPAEYADRMQRIAAMLNQALSDRPTKDNHPQQKP